MTSKWIQPSMLWHSSYLSFYRKTEWWLTPKVHLPLCFSANTHSHYIRLPIALPPSSMKIAPGFLRHTGLTSCCLFMAVGQPIVCVTDNHCGSSSVCLPTHFCVPEATAATLWEEGASMCIKVISLVLILCASAMCPGAICTITLTLVNLETNSGQRVEVWKTAHSSAL